MASSVATFSLGINEFPKSHLITLQTPKAPTNQSEASWKKRRTVSVLCVPRCYAQAHTTGNSPGRRRPRFSFLYQQCQRANLEFKPGRPESQSQFDCETANIRPKPALALHPRVPDHHRLDHLPKHGTSVNQRSIGANPENLVTTWRRIYGQARHAVKHYCMFYALFLRLRNDGHPPASLTKPQGLVGYDKPGVNRRAGIPKTRIRAMADGVCFSCITAVTEKPRRFPLTI